MAARVPGVPPPGAAAPPAAEKKGEVNELRALLKAVNTDRDSKRKRDVIKKVIAYMTLGIDVSRLFSDMILACNTRDVVIKKMIYLFLCTYAQANPELSLLAINTLQKDCRDEDPMIRGLALRSLTSLRIPSILEYVMPPLKASLTDHSGYVRQNGVMGVLKVFHLSPETAKEYDFVDTLYNMLRDSDPQVVINCVTTLNEVLAEEGGMSVNQAIVHHLLNRMREFNEWGQCVVLEVLAAYTPASEDEMYGLMNILDACVKVSCSAVVLGATKCFIRLTAGNAELQRAVFARLKTPLLTLTASASNELAYAVLSHVRLIVERAPGIFDDEFKQFFAKFNEPSGVKALKMGILPRLANAANAREVVAELTEYVSGVDADLARQAVRAIGDIAIRVPAASEHVVEALLELIEMDAEYVRAETVTVMQDVLRKYPDRAPSVIPSLHRVLKRLEDATGRAAVIWMIGEYGQLIDDAPYTLEPLIDSFKDEASVLVRSELLSATVKLFFKRPPEVQRMLGRLFKACLADGVNAAVHDRALLYFRLLRASVKDAAAVIASEHAPVREFHDEQSAEVKEAIWREFNTLSIVYGKPAPEFIAADHLIATPPPPPPPVQAKPAGASDDDALLSGSDSALPAESATPTYGAPAAAAPGGGLVFAPPPPAAAAVPYATPAPAPPPPAPAADLMDDLLGISFSPAPAPAPAFAAPGFGAPSFAAAPAPAPAPAASPWDDLFGSPAPAPPPAPPAAPALLAGAVLAPDAFQAKWGVLQVGASLSLRVARLPAGPAELEALSRAALLYTIASGDLGPQIKLFLYAQDAPGVAFHLIEAVLDKATGAFSATVKSERGPAGAQAAGAAFAAAMRPLLA